MAENGIRQLGPPRIGIFAERHRPEPKHCEINAWQQVLSILYLESVQRDKFPDFIEVLGQWSISAFRFAECRSIYWEGMRVGQFANFLDWVPTIILGV